MKDARIYIDRHDWWIGYYCGAFRHHVCIIPWLVISWPRRNTEAEITESEAS